MLGWAYVFLLLRYVRWWQLSRYVVCWCVGSSDRCIAPPSVPEGPEGNLNPQADWFATGLEDMDVDDDVESLMSIHELGGLPDFDVAEEEGLFWVDNAGNIGVGTPRLESALTLEHLGANPGVTAPFVSGDYFSGSKQVLWAKIIKSFFSELELVTCVGGIARDPSQHQCRAPQARDGDQPG